jgi:hypothetical protein
MARGNSNRIPAAPPQQTAVARERITTHIRSILTEVAPDRVDLLTPVVERCITSAVEPPRAEAAMRAGAGIGALSTDATSAGADLMARATELPFPQFVANLVTGTFDAIVASHIAQSKAYAELVADLAKTIQEFETENVTTAQVDEWLAQSAPDGNGGTKVKTGAPYEQAVFTDIVDVRLAKVWDGTFTKPATPPATATTWDQTTVTAIRAGVKRHLATTGLQMLRAMARDGMQFVAVTHGEIHAKLTFNVTATDEQARTSSETEVKARSFAAGASASWRWLRASASYGSSTLRVKSVNERTYNKVTMDAQLIGEVTLQFQTRTLPVIE